MVESSGKIQSLELDGTLFAGDEGRRREDKLKRLDLLELRLQRFERIDRETRGRYPEPGTRLYRLLEIVTEQPADVVEYFHCASKRSPRRLRPNNYSCRGKSASNNDLLPHLSGTCLNKCTVKVIL